MAKINPDQWNNSMNLVFTDKTGNHLTAITVFRHFKLCAKAIGKPELRFHDIRHNFASHLAMIGIPVTTAAKIAATGWIKCQKSYSVKTNGIST